MLRLPQPQSAHSSRSSLKGPCSSNVSRPEAVRARRLQLLYLCHRDRFVASSAAVGAGTSRRDIACNLSSGGANQALSQIESL